MERCRQAAMLLPPALRARVLAQPGEVLAQTEEVRLRAGHPMCLTIRERERSIPGTKVTARDLEQVVDLATRCSPYTARETMCRGYLTAEGGFRVGVCGFMVSEGERICAVRALSALSIRIPREKRDVAEPVMSQLLRDGRLENTLVLSPPGVGKTTFLRDAVRLLSDEYGLRVALVDQREELAAMREGIAQLDVGQHTDVITGCSKALAIPAILRAMSPQVIAVDEVVEEEEIQAMERAAHSGAALLASVHAPDLEGLRRKSLFASLFSAGIFRYAVIISRCGDIRSFTVEEIR